MLSWLRSALLENLSLKLFALLLAIILFRRVNLEDPTRVTTVDVKLLYNYPRKKVVMTSELVPSIKVTLQGPESKLKTIATRVWTYTVPLPGASPGPVQAELYTQEIRSIFPGEIQVTRIKPSILNMRFDNVLQRTLPIHVRLKGKPPVGYRLITPVKPTPTTVEVAGPAQIVQKLKQIYTQPVDLTGLTRPETTKVKLTNPGKYVRFLGRKADEIRVVLRFHVVQGRKPFKDVPVKVLNFLNPKLEYELHPSKIDLVVVGPVAQLHSLQAKELTVSVDGSKIASRSPGEHRVPLRIQLPAPDLQHQGAPSSIILKTLSKDGPSEGVAPDAGAKRGRAPPPRLHRRMPLKRRKLRKRKRRRRRRRRLRHKRRKKAKRRKPRRHRRRKHKRRKKRLKPRRVRPKARSKRRKKPRRRPPTRRPSKESTLDVGVKRRRVAQSKSRSRLLKVLKSLPTRLPSLSKKLLGKPPGKVLELRRRQPPKAKGPARSKAKSPPRRSKARAKRPRRRSKARTQAPPHKTPPPRK